MNSSWNEIFMDEEACGAQDSSSNSDYVPSEADGESDDGIHTMHSESFNLAVGPDSKVAGKVIKVLEFMEELGINLTTFLDAVSWGNEMCISSSKVCTARTGPMNSEKLPTILSQWWKPPRVSGTGNPRLKGAGMVMESFALRCCHAIADCELERLAVLFESPPGEDVAEEN